MQATVTVWVQNTSSSDILLNSFAGNLLSNGTMIGNVSNFSGVGIPGNSNVQVPLTVELFPVGLVSDLINSFNSGSGVQNLELDAMVNANGYQLPVTLKYKINV